MPLTILISQALKADKETALPCFLHSELNKLQTLLNPSPMGIDLIRQQLFIEKPFQSLIMPP
jgi:hypothetical protein